jgi:hypothetical protein
MIRGSSRMQSSHAGIHALAAMAGVLATQRAGNCDIYGRDGGNSSLRANSENLGKNIRTID